MGAKNLSNILLLNALGEETYDSSFDFIVNSTSCRLFK